MSSIGMYAAPLEGITGFVWRKAQDDIFGGADKFFTPFVTVNQTRSFKTREMRDLSQQEPKLVPQILTDKAEHFLWAAAEFGKMGFEEVNLNLGCPSSTVVTKGRGSGMLKDPERLDAFLHDIFSANAKQKISIKTRIGFSDRSEWELLLRIFEQYPVEELTLHARIREEYYEGNADRELFKRALEKTSLRMVYNGDVREPGDEAFSYGCSVMAGRGLVADPALFRKARGGKKASEEEMRAFHSRILEGYQSYMSGDDPVLRHMKELWIYMKELFTCDDRYFKKLRKAKGMKEYLSHADEIMKWIK